MPASIEELTTPLSPDEAKTSIFNVLAAVGAKTTTWKKGAVVRTIIAALSIVIAGFSELQALIAKSGFLELAEQDWLVLVARHVFGVEKILATFAVGEVTLTNTGGGVFNPAAGDIVFKNTATGKTYRNTAPFALGVGGVVTVGIDAVEAGSDSSAAAGQIDDFETAMVGVLVTNGTSVVGLDEETDPELRQRCLEKRSALSPNGPGDAYAFFAKGATRQSDGTNIGITRVKVSANSSTGVVDVYVANPGGAVSGIATDPLTDLGAVDLAIKTNVVPIGVTEFTHSAAAAPIPVIYEIWAHSTINLTDVEMSDLVAERLTALMTSEPIGGNVITVPPGVIYADAIRTTIGASRPEIFHVVVTVPAANVILAPNEVPMLGVSTMTALHRVNQ